MSLMIQTIVNVKDSHLSCIIDCKIDFYAGNKLKISFEPELHVTHSSPELLSMFGFAYVLLHWIV